VPRSRARALAGRSTRRPARRSTSIVLWLAPGGRVSHFATGQLQPVSRRSFTVAHSQPLTFTVRDLDEKASAGNHLELIRVSVCLRE
jgi:hypothetical protein